MIRPKRIIESTVGLVAAANFRQLAKQIVCVGRNYPDPVVDAKLPKPTRPILFMKSANAFISESQNIRRPPGCKKLLTEVELGVVFGKTTSNVSRNEAMNYVAGYTVALDMTAGDILEDLRSQSLPWFVAKSFTTSCPVAEFLPKNFVPDPHQLELLCRVNGEERQRESTSKMFFDVPTLIEFASSYMTLEAGDVMLTGTPTNVKECKEGDQIDIYLSNLLKATFFVE
ncbi:FAH family protein [Aphelenchoides bicaudatus]|nr:FAH family protein [Aphelenchoides bicaudatus]